MKILNKNKRIKNIVVILAIIIFAICSYISYRSNYLQTLEIGAEYISVLNKNYEYKLKLFIFNFALIFISTYICNRSIKKGLKIFFETEKKELPKLPNKSIAFILSIIVSVFINKIFLDKFILFINNTWFGINDPIFGLDIGFYFFQKPFIKLVLYYLITLLAFFIVYISAYYIIVFNIYLQGIDKQMLIKSKFIKNVKKNLFFMVVLIAGNIFLSTYDILLQEFISIKDILNTKIIGAGITDITIKLWGYRILCAVVIISSIFILKNIFKNNNLKKILKSILAVPVYLLSMIIVILIFNVLFINSNKFDKEKEYIGYNIDYTKLAYNINIEEQTLENNTSITKQELEENKSIVENINILDNETILKNLNQLQTSSDYYSYKTTAVQMYRINEEDTLTYISPREIEISRDISNRNKKYVYTHGFGSIITYANKVDNTGNLEYIQKTINDAEESIYIEEPRIYFGLKNNNPIITNVKYEQEFDYPISSVEAQKNSYNGKSGINVSFIDKLILSIFNKDINLTFSKTDENSKVLLNRNIIERAKKIMPYLIYDEEPYMIISDEGRQIWVLDAYTVSNEYPYSQKTRIKVGDYRKEINYIRNSIKVLIDAYNGTMDFYITDSTDPVVVAYSHAYPELFKDGNEIPEGIKSHFIYPKYLYNVQAEILKVYHNVTEDVLYRGNDIWDYAVFSASLKNTTKTDIESYYTMVNINNKNQIGLIVPYTVYGKQNITSYLVGVDNNGKLQLKLYRYASGSNVLGPEQLDKEIEQDEYILNEIKSINVTGTKILKNLVIVPINNSILYVESIYQQQLNDKNAVPLLKKVVVASGNKVAIGDNVKEALENLASQSAVNIKVESTDTVDDIISSIIEANENLKDSTEAKDFEMIGKDITRLQTLIEQLEDKKKENDNKKESNITEVIEE